MAKNFLRLFVVVYARRERCAGATMTKKEPTVERHVMASNETFEVPVPVDEASVLGFTFEVEDDATVEFSVAFKASGRKKTTQLLAPATYGRNAGEVLLPSAGECIVRWHNPAGCADPDGCVTRAINPDYRPTLDLRLRVWRDGFAYLPRSRSSFAS